MVHEIWVWVAVILGYAIGFGCGIWCGIWFIIEFLKGFPSIDFSDWDIF